MLTNKYHKSSRSGGQGACVAVRLAPSGGVQVMDTKDPACPTRTAPAPAWLSFVGAVKRGAYDLR